MTSRRASHAHTGSAFQCLPLLSLLPIAAFAQTAPASKAVSETPDAALQEIVITAEKRNSSVQQTAISLTALSGSDLQEQGISGLGDAAREIPGVAQTASGPGQTEYTIRGLSSAGPAVSTVGFYLDDVPMTAPAGAQNGHVAIDPNLYDLNRIEVLRGPQGTLYGSGSMGGTIKLVTNQPDVNEFAGSAKADGSWTAGGGLNGDVNAMLNVPLIPGTLALRVVGTDEHLSGWINRTVLSDFPLPTNPQPQCAPFAGCTRGNLAGAAISANHEDVNSEDLHGIRGSLRYEPIEQLTLTASAMYQTLAQGGLSYYDNPPGPDGEAHFQPFDLAEPFSDTFRLYNLGGDLRLAPFTLTSVTSYWTRSQSQTQDISETVQTLFGVPSFYEAAGGIGPESITEIDRTTQFSQEVRLTSAGDTALQWLIGGFYSNFTYGQNQFSLADGLAPLFGSTNLYTGVIQDRIKQTAQFGELSYKWAKGLKATLGLRHYSYTQRGSTTKSGIAAGTDVPATTYNLADHSGFNPKLTVSYDLDRNLLVYATAAKGFRPGAGNSLVPTSGTDSCLPDLQSLGKNSAPSQYDPDTVWSYEVGEKATLLDRRMTVNAAVYYERWNAVQQQILLGCGFGYIDNVGKAAVRGGELEINFKISPAWTVVQTGGYTHAVLTSTESGTGLSDGQKLPNVPSYSLSTSLVYSRPVGDYTLVVRATNAYVASQQVQSYFLETLPGYDLASVRMGVVADRWSAFAFVNNLINRRAALNIAQNYALDIPSLDRVATNQPRTAGLTLEYHF